MKKSLFFAAAASALMLTACSSESDVVQNTTPTTQTTVQQQAVGFDTYTAGTTRAGYAGVMTTDKLKTNTVGFGVFSVYQDGTKYGSLAAANKVPNFMFNQQVSYSDAWTYSPLKYWPNETTNDSQTSPAESTHTDYLSFFAYAPYVNLTTAGSMITNDADHDADPADGLTAAYVEATPSTGILAVTKENYQGDPLVEWKIAATDNLDGNVDLLWGVAPAGGLSYTNVAGTSTTVAEGLPLLDMVKPNKDQKMKFLFQHALSRIGLTVVSAIDQIAPGGNLNAGETRVLIKSVEIWGDFGKQGVLNLNNTTTNEANWIAASIDKSSKSDVAELFTINASNGNLAADLRYVASQISDVGTDVANFTKVNPGVGTSEQTLLAGGADPNKKATDLTYAYGKVLYKLSGSDYVRATTTAPTDVNIYEIDGTDYKQVKKASVGSLTMNGTKQYWKVGTKGAATVVANDGDALGMGTWYKVVGTEGEVGSKYEKFVSSGTANAGTYYPSITWDEVLGANYTGDCYTALTPRYFMVIPTGDTPIKVKITYAVVTKDEKLTGNVSDVENAITKEISLNLKNGKSYNLKLILGLTSVKMEAEVADWKVDGSTDVNLPRNNE